MAMHMPRSTATSTASTTALLLTCLTVVATIDSQQSGDPCFCQLNGDIGDCECTSESVDVFNNHKIFPLLDELLRRDYFRYYKVDLFRPCLFSRGGSGQCSSRGCAVDHCRESEIPAGLKNDKSHDKYSKQANENDSNCKKGEDNEDKLGKLDVELSQESQEAFVSWTKHDDLLENFCETGDVASPEAEFYDLIRNPERFTGYSGPSAVNIWKLIYEQNCFKPDKPDYEHYLSIEQGMSCLEKRIFFRLISGFHTSINVDVVANWLIPGKNAFEPPRWGPNVEEFVRRFDPRQTNGEGPRRLQNMYFAYLVEMRALIKAAPYLAEELFFTGNEVEDEAVRDAVRQLLDLLKSFPHPFDESQLFQGNARKLKEDFKVHFRNISLILDCVGCDKCRLWGKVQFSGLATALKILFSGDSMNPDSVVSQEHRRSATMPFQLMRSDIVALFNGFGRLSKSLHEVELFRLELAR
jgi:hypothetical protein